MVGRIARLAVASLALGSLLGGPASFGAAPVLSLTDPGTGEDVAIAPSPGVLHVVYFATWCPECVRELPELADLESRWAERPYRLVLVAVNTRQTKSRLANFVETQHPPGRLLFDADGQAALRMKVDQLPTHVLLGPGGEELARAGSLSEIRRPLEQRLSSKGLGKR